MRRLMICGAAALLFALPANATAYNFNVLYTGSNTASLVGGSDNPLTTTMNAGDSFVYTLTAQGNGQWTVTNGGDFDFLDALPVSESDTRTSDYTLDLYNNGSLVFSDTESVSNSFVHLGTNVTTLTTGLVFDQMVLNDTIAAATTTSTPISLLPIFGAPEANTLTSATVTYGAGTDSVPEPMTLALFGAGLAGLGAMRRRRKTPA
jgi:hypothetical protein